MTSLWCRESLELSQQKFIKYTQQKRSTIVSSYSNLVERKNETTSYSVDYTELYQNSLGAQVQRKSICVDVIEKGNDRYKNYDPQNQNLTNDIIGKHIQEFQRETPESVPDIFIALINYFEEFPELMETEGIFRIVGNYERIDEL